MKKQVIVNIIPRRHDGDVQLQNYHAHNYETL